MSLRGALCVVIVLMLFVAADSVFAQGGSIGLYAGTDGVMCAMNDDTPGLFVVYVVHIATSGALASRFAVRDHIGFTGLWLSDTPTFPLWTGCTHCPDGFFLSYGVCAASPIVVTMMNYFAYGTSAKCSLIEVIPPPDSPTQTIDVVICNGTLREATGLKLVVNPDASCPCDEVPAEATTWGRLKALYLD